MRSLLSTVAAAVAGFVLAVLLVYVVGALAALQTPAWLAGLSRSNPGTVSLASTFLLVSLPVGLVAFVFGTCLFRLLRSSRRLVFVACLAGWLVSVLLLQVVVYSSSANEAVSQMAGLSTSASYWLAMLPVPVGLGLASLAGGASPSVKRTA